MAFIISIFKQFFNLSAGSAFIGKYEVLAVSIVFITVLDSSHIIPTIYICFVKNFSYYIFLNIFLIRPMASHLWEI